MRAAWTSAVVFLIVGVGAGAAHAASSNFFDNWSTSTIGGGPGSAWGVENATDPNNGNVHYYNTLPAQATSTRLTTLQVISDPTATYGRALRMTIQPDPSFSTNHIYQSAEISTKLDPAGIGNNLQYGHIEASIKVAGATGTGADSVWPAFWMLGKNISTVGWPTCGELDIMETRGDQENINQAHLHTNKTTGGDVNGGVGVGTTYTLPGGAYMYNAYHTYAIDWSPGSITWSLDGISYLTETPTSSNFTSASGVWQFDGHPFYLILDICQGGQFANTGHDLTQALNMDIAYVSVSVPEPGAMLLVMVGAMSSLLIRRRCPLS